MIAIRRFAFAARNAASRFARRCSRPRSGGRLPAWLPLALRWRRERKRLTSSRPNVVAVAACAACQSKSHRRWLFAVHPGQWPVRAKSASPVVAASVVHAVRRSLIEWHRRVQLACAPAGLVLAAHPRSHHVNEDRRSVIEWPRRAHRDDALATPGIAARPRPHRFADAHPMGRTRSDVAALIVRSTERSHGAIRSLTPPPAEKWQPIIAFHTRFRGRAERENGLLTRLSPGRTFPFSLDPLALHAHRTQQVDAAAVDCAASKPFASFANGTDLTWRGSQTENLPTPAEIALGAPRAATAGTSLHSGASMAASSLGHAPELVWRTQGRSNLRTSGEIDSSDARVRTAGISPSAGASVATQQVALLAAKGATPERVTSLDPALIDRLADDVIRRVERHVRIERERRGL